jgi:hypothetical protein
MEDKRWVNRTFEDLATGEGFKPEGKSLGELSLGIVRETQELIQAHDDDQFTNSNQHIDPLAYEQMKRGIRSLYAIPCACRTGKRCFLHLDNGITPEQAEAWLDVLGDRALVEVLPSHLIDAMLGGTLATMMLESIAKMDAMIAEMPEGPARENARAMLRSAHRHREQGARAVRDAMIREGAG